MLRLIVRKALIYTAMAAYLLVGMSIVTGFGYSLTGRNVVWGMAASYGLAYVLIEHVHVLDCGKPTQT